MVMRSALLLIAGNLIASYFLFAIGLHPVSSFILAGTPV